MPIDLGLGRVIKLLGLFNNPHLSYKSIHIAGTNGKGSTIAYLSSIFTASKVRNGRFTSPHIIYYNDCIAINNETYPLDKFKKINDEVLQKNQIHNVGCTEFELLTVTAFKIFESEKVEVAVIEVGVGGRLDSTNVLPPLALLATGITKIGFDHEGLLGDTLSKIAYEKAGIIKQGVPCVVDNTNEWDVKETIIGEGKHSPLYFVKDEAASYIQLSPLQGNYQLNNLSVALTILELTGLSISQESILKGIASTSWPGRLQKITLKNGLDILLDGAHNESAVIELGKFLETYREESIIFVIGITAGKAVSKLLQHIVRKDDLVIASGFTQPEGMPWILSYPAAEIQKQSQPFCEVDPIIEDNLSSLFDYVKEIKGNRKVVVCGSLYLCGDVLRL